MRLSVVVPCFNEEANVAQVVRQAALGGRTVASELEIIVVDDGSTDETATVLSELRQVIAELRVVRHPRNRGYGAAIRSGLEHATMDYVFLTDGDGQFDLSQLPSALRMLREHDVVAGYRVRRRDGWWRRLWGRAWTALVNRALGLRVKDANCAFKVLPLRLAQVSDLRSDGALISAELLSVASRSGFTIGECPVAHYPRLAGRQTGASPRVVATAFVELAAHLTRATQARQWQGSRASRRG